jgi:hypothetical protein
MGMHIDKPWSNNQAIGVYRTKRTIGDPAHGDDPAILDPYISGTSRRTGTVHNPAAPD